MKTHVLTMGLAGITATVLIVILACSGEQRVGAKSSEPANNAPAAAQCGRDSDCKGDRICDRGQCVSPR